VADGDPAERIIGTTPPSGLPDQLDRRADGVRARPAGPVRAVHPLLGGSEP